MAALYTQESLTSLKQRIDLVEVLSTHIELKKSGASYKGLCPFHDEKSPSFMIQKGDSHYHCFGCGAHGDAIQFLMSYLKMSFTEAVEALAERFHVHLEKVENSDAPKGPSKTRLKEALEQACQFYHFLLLHTKEGHAALQYLYNRGLDLEFVKLFQIGLSPSSLDMLQKILTAKNFYPEEMEAAGLIHSGNQNNHRDFFHDRIMFPIRDHAGAVIGFSARKYKDSTQGGKYINTPETPLFKKSRILFGLNYCRRRIAKERRAIIVEGQIDALRLIHVGFNITVAGQGTAFGETHVQELCTLGVNQVYLALDGDKAGKEASFKIGNLFQLAGVAVNIINLPPGLDPDTFLQQEGTEKFIQLLEASQDYLSFLVAYKSEQVEIHSPARKNHLIQEIIQQIRSWNQPIVVHESLKKLALLTNTPEQIIGISQEYVPNVYIKKTALVGKQSIDHDQILETDLLRCLLTNNQQTPQIWALIQANIKQEHFKISACLELYRAYVHCHTAGKPLDLLSLLAETADPQAQEIMHGLLEKKVNREKTLEHTKEAIQKILDRQWIESREDIKLKINNPENSEETLSSLLKVFENLKRPLLK
jgi:DNA primase